MCSFHNHPLWSASLLMLQLQHWIQMLYTDVIAGMVPATVSNDKKFHFLWAKNAKSWKQKSRNPQKKCFVPNVPKSHLRLSNDQNLHFLWAQNAKKKLPTIWLIWLGTDWFDSRGLLDLLQNHLIWLRNTWFNAGSPDFT